MIDISAHTAAGENPLSDREMDVAQLLATGASNAEIARALNISPHTVKVHLRNIFEKLAVSSRTEASMLLVQRGWLVVPGVTATGDDPESTPALPRADAPLEWPESMPTGRVKARPTAWQLLWMVGALLLVIGAMTVPNLTAQPTTRADLLTDAGYTSLGQPTIEPQSRWEARTPLAQPRSRLAFTLAGDRLFALGGERGGEILSEASIYNLRVNEWSTVADLPAPRSNAAAAPHDGQIFVAGGSSPADQGNDAAPVVQDTFFAYTIATDRWQILAPLPNPLAGAALVTAADGLYLVGGWDGVAMRDEVWRLPFADEGPAGHWELVTRLPVPRAFLGAALVGEKLYVVGGYDGQQELNDADLLDLATGDWQRLPPLSTPRGGMTLVYDGLALFALGGGWTYPIKTHERYDPATNVWSNFPSPIQGEWRHLGAASRDGRLHLVGGWSGAYLETHFQYQSSFRALLPVITND